MHLHICRLAMMLSVLALCSCNITLLPGNGTPSSIGATPPIPAQDPTFSVSPDLPENVVTQPPLTPSPTYSIVDLHCTNYVEAKWGAGLGEFGLCPASSDAWIRGPYPPVLNKQGDLFIVDKANQRIVKYSGGIASQIIPIPSSYVYDVCGYASRWPNVSVSEDRLFLHFYIQQDNRIVGRLAILSLEGAEQQVIDLEPYYPLDSSPYLNSLISDRKGGVYLLLPPAGVVHFDADLRPTLIYLGPDASYEDLIVGWDGNIYKYDPQNDHLSNWGTDNRLFMYGEPLSSMANVIAATGIVSPTYTRFRGADTQGRLYFTTRERDRDLWIVRISASWDQGIIAAVSEEELSPSVLAPDGSLYDIVYDQMDSSISPRIVRCVFGSD